MALNSALYHYALSTPLRQHLSKGYLALGIKYKGGLLHWNYFLALEHDLDQASRFIEFSEQNFPVYSIELAHIFLATCSEIDVVQKPKGSDSFDIYGKMLSPAPSSQSGFKYA